MSSFGESQRSSIHTHQYRSRNKTTERNKNELLEKLLVLLTTDIPDLAKSVWEAFDNEKVVYQVTELEKSKEENERLRKDLDKLQTKVNTYNETEDKNKTLATKLQETIRENGRLKDIEKKYEERNQEFEDLKNKFENEKRRMQQEIKEQKDKIQTLQNTQSRASTKHEYRSGHGTYESEKYNNIEKQLKSTKEKLKRTENELDETKTRLSQSLGNKLLDNNPNIADLSDMHRPTKLAELYQELYDNEWTEAFESITKKEDVDEKSVVSTLLNILMETKSVCEVEADKQLKAIQLAITQDDRNVEYSEISRMNKQLKECRKAVAVYSGKQVYKKYIEKLKQSGSSTASKAKSVPEYLKKCFDICWLMAVQDPPIAFGPNIDRGNVFDIDLYKAYTRRGNRVAYVVWPALLLHKGGAVLCKGVAQGLADLSKRPSSAPHSFERKEDIYGDSEESLSGLDQNAKGRKDHVSVVEIESNDEYPTAISSNVDSRITNGHHRDFSYRQYSTKAEDTYDTYKGHYDYRFSEYDSYLGTGTLNRYVPDANFERSSYKRKDFHPTYTNYQSRDVHYSSRGNPHTHKYHIQNTYKQRIVTPRPVWK